MPANKNALIRYKTIDNCLRNPYRRWTLDDLVDEGLLRAVEHTQRDHDLCGEVGLADFRLTCVCDAGDLLVKRVGDFEHDVDAFRDDAHVGCGDGRLSGLRVGAN